MKYYILELKYTTIKSITISSEYLVVDTRDIQEPLLEINNHLVLDINATTKQKIYLGTIYFKTNNLIEFAEKIAELKQERRKINLYSEK